MARCGKGGWPVEPSIERIYILDGSGDDIRSKHAPSGKKRSAVSRFVLPLRI